MNLSEGERRIVTEIVREEAPDLLGQLREISAVSRTFTGIGVFVEFSSERQPTPSTFTGYLGSKLYLVIPGSPEVFQAHLGVRNGSIEVLEIAATDGETFPDNLEVFEIRRFKDILT